MNIAIRNDIYTKLNQSDEFTNLANNQARIEFVLNNIMNFDDIKSTVKTNMAQAKQQHGKNISLAKNFKMEGNHYLYASTINPDLSGNDKNINLRKALESYTKAIINVPILQDVQLAAKLYGRKCQIHIQLEEYEAALYSSEIALDICKTYGDQSAMISLFQSTILKIHCLTLLYKFEEALKLIDSTLNSFNDDRFIVETLKNNNISKDDLLNMRKNIESAFNESSNRFFITPDDLTPIDEEYFNYKIDERCSIKHSPVVGRHFIANDDIAEGTIILKENPYSIIIENDYLHKKCSACYRNLDYKIFPCVNCTELLFCNRTCYLNAFNTFHKHECGLIALLKNGTSPLFHVFRMMSRVGPLNAYETERSLPHYSIEDYLSEENQRKLPETMKTLDEKLRAYKMSSILWDHNSKHSNCSNVHHTVIGIELAALMDHIHGIFTDRSNEFLLDFIDMLIVDIRRIIFNVFGWHEYNKDWSLRGHIANCQCLVGSLINHSCVPNTNWEFVNGQIKFTTNKFISKGEEITITYGPNKDISYNKRQERLNHYFFACKCSVCVTDAGKNKALKCIECNGPVPFDVSVNKEPILNGQCLLCFKKYPDFIRNTEEYEKCLKHLETISKIVLLHPNPILFEQAKNLLIKFIKLSLSPNIYVDKALLYMINIMRWCNNLIDHNEKLHLINIIDSNLPEEPAYLDNDETLNNLLYCYRILMDTIYGSTPNTDSMAILVELSKYNVDIIRMVNNFKKRIDNHYISVGSLPNKHQIVDDILKISLDNLTSEYGYYNEILQQ